MFGQGPVLSDQGRQFWISDSCEKGIGCSRLLNPVFQFLQEVVWEIWVIPLRPDVIFSQRIQIKAFQVTKPPGPVSLKFKHKEVIKKERTGSEQDNPQQQNSRGERVNQQTIIMQESACAVCRHRFKMNFAVSGSKSSGESESRLRAYLSRKTLNLPSKRKPASRSRRNI